MGAAKPPVIGQRLFDRRGVSRQVVKIHGGRPYGLYLGGRFVRLYERERLAVMDNCPPPIRQTDENYCRECMLRWSVDEDRPRCARQKSFPRKDKK